jgi:hypothetical protein
LPVQKKVLSLCRIKETTKKKEIKFFMSTKPKATAAGQSPAAANTNQTATTPVATTTNTANAATVTATPIIKGAVKNPPKQRVVAAPKVQKESKRVTGVTINVATTTYNNWSSWVRFILNGSDKTVPMMARFVKDKEAKGTEWGGYISTPAANVDAVVAALAAFTANEATLPVEERSIVMWNMLDVFTSVEPKVRAPRAKKVKAEVAPAEADVAEVVA